MFIQQSSVAWPYRRERRFFFLSDVVGDSVVGSLRTVGRARRDVPGFQINTPKFSYKSYTPNRTSLQRHLVTSCASFSAFSLPEQLAAPS